MEENKIYLGRSGDTWSYKKYYYEFVKYCYISICKN